MPAAPDHPTAPRADADRLASDAIRRACELACVIRDDGPDAALQAIQQMPADTIPLVMIMMAAMIPDDQPATTLLAWAVDGWPAHADRLDPALLPYATIRTGRGGRRKDEQACGSVAAYRRHKRRGEQPCDSCEATWKLNNQACYRQRADQRIPRERARKPRTRTGEPRPCAACDATVEKIVKGYCTLCYSRWLYYGRPAGGPPPKDQPRPARPPKAIPARCKKDLHDLTFGTVIILATGAWRCRACHNATRARWLFNSRHRSHQVIEMPEGHLACFTCSTPDAPAQQQGPRSARPAAAASPGDPPTPPADTPNFLLERLTA
ncbi:hypothetical protein AB0F17_35085 [Nonomuraea sp. NPDC026600]|uniref:hypothetical protein n=1 Tax=Nonomuraea sp. NPDC026600 TaxID=3155363 RepID=UPI0034032FEA